MKNIEGALTALDMVHADLWLKRKNLRETDTKSIIVNETEIQCLILLVEAAMKDLGFKREFKK